MRRYARNDEVKIRPICEPCGHVVFIQIDMGPIDMIVQITLIVNRVLAAPRLPLQINRSSAGSTPSEAFLDALYETPIVVAAILHGDQCM